MGTFVYYPTVLNSNAHYDAEQYSPQILHVSLINHTFFHRKPDRDGILGILQRSVAIGKPILFVSM